MSFFDINSHQNSKSKRFGALARRQLGVLTRAQAAEAGLSAAELRSELESGRWERVGRGVYRVVGAPESWEQRVWVACLETGGLASHRTAGWLWRLDGLGRAPPEEIEVLLAMTNRHTTEGARVRHSRTLLPSHVCKRPGLPRTNLARTVVDLAGVLDAGALELAFESALRQQPDLRDWLKRMLRPLPSQGHRGISNLTRLLAERTPAVDSALEVRLRRLLRSAGLPAPQAGVDVVESGVHVAKLDFAWPRNRPRVALMAHGARWHGNTKRWKRDLSQASQLTGLGWRVVQCSFDDVEQRPEELLRNLRRALAGFDAPAELGHVVEH